MPNRRERAPLMVDPRTRDRFKKAAREVGLSMASLLCILAARIERGEVLVP